MEQIYSYNAGAYTPVSSQVDTDLIIVVVAVKKRLFFEYHASEHAAQAPQVQ